MKKDYVIDDIDVSCEDLFRMTREGTLVERMKELKQVRDYEIESNQDGDDDNMSRIVYNPVIPLPEVFLPLADSFRCIKQTATYFPNEKKSSFELHPKSKSKGCLYKICGKSKYEINKQDPSKTDLKIKINVVANRKLLQKRLPYIPEMGVDMMIKMLEKQIVDNFVRNSVQLHRNIDAS